MKLIDIYNKIESGSLVTSPDFQRKLVWKKQHKYAFIKTILLNFPFPEVYIASSEVDVESLKAREIVVDGQQRLTTIVEYIKGVGDFKAQKQVTPFDDLSNEEKREILNYSITVKDLKDIGMENIKEVFKRINSTDYSLNLNEVLNAEYGDGEFSMFCKQVIDKKFKPSEETTDIVLDKEIKSKLNTFFIDNAVFSENDVKRMFDVQYIMLITSTILEGNYFGRSTKINSYLQKYNVSFDLYSDVLNSLINSIDIINSLRFSSNSYWFNKANLFTLIIEFNELDVETIHLDLLESKLLDLEKRVDIYFTDEDISMITDDERKYFESARQGSHELAERKHRGKVIRQLINECLIVKETLEIDNTLSNNLEFLKAKNISFSILIPTETGLTKHIMDATSAVREFLKSSEIHDYDKQPFGPDHKKELKGLFVSNEKSEETNISLYRSNGRGDYRIWFSELKSFAKANDELALITKDGIINILNLTNYDCSNLEV